MPDYRRVFDAMTDSLAEAERFDTRSRCSSERGVNGFQAWAPPDRGDVWDAARRDSRVQVGQRLALQFEDG
jgi:hypothetical protein